MTDTTTYVPKKTSNAWRALMVLSAKSGEWMSSIDLAAKIGASNEGISNMLQPGLRCEVFELKKVNTKNYYRLGPKAVEVVAKAVQKPDAAVEPAPQAPAFLPKRSIFDQDDRPIPMPRGAAFGVLADGRINVTRDGRTTEQFSPTEARALAGVLRARVVKGAAR